jgi:hypothetical protein
VVCETPNDEEDGQHGEADELEGFATDGVNGRNGEPITGDSSRANQDTVTSSELVKLVINSRSAPVANSLEDGSLVET